MCHALLQDPKFFLLLLRADQELAEELRAGGCPCGGVLHHADYPRKPRGCLNEIRADYQSRFSFCCSRCRKRFTSMSVRFLGRRVYLALAVVLVSAQRAESASASRLSGMLAVPRRTVERWRRWWGAQFPLTPLWRSACARFMPPVLVERLPASLLERFTGLAPDCLMRLLVFLTPLTVRLSLALREGR